MPKPSMFSKDYEKQMKRRRLNRILVILIIISAGYFGAKYYFKNNGFPKVGNIFSKFSFHIGKQSNAENQPLPEVTPQEQVTPTPTPPEEKYYEYTSSNGDRYKATYKQNTDGISFNGLECSGVRSNFDISPDKKSIIFEDKGAKDIILMDSEGKTYVMNPDSYTSKSSGYVITKEDMLERDPSYIWAANPHFSSNETIVYISDLPYTYDDGVIYMWSTDKPGSRGLLIGSFEIEDAEKITYDGYNEDGNLVIRFNEKTYYFKPGSYWVTQ